MLFAYRARGIASKLGNEEEGPVAQRLVGGAFEFHFYPPVEMRGAHRAGKAGLALQEELLLVRRDQCMDLVRFKQCTVAHAADFHEIQLHSMPFLAVIRSG